jgi:hypothetical protein
MAVNKNFVVKNGIEIAVNLIYGDTDLQKVGIGSTTPRSLLDVHGDLRVETGAYITGVTTAADELNVGLGGTALTVLNSNGFSGFNIANPVYNVDVRRRAGAGDTAAYFLGQVNVDGTLVPNNLRVAGLSTLSNVNIDDGEVEIAKLEVTGLSTFTGIGTFASDLYVGSNLNVAGNLNVIGDIVYDEISGRNIYISGVSTFVGVSTFQDNVYIDGISTLDGVKIGDPSGIITASSSTGIVTYYGDGSYLTGAAPELQAAIGIGSEGVFIGAGVTQLNFNSTNGTAITVDPATVGIATVTFTPGVSLGLAIALGS